MPQVGHRDTATSPPAHLDGMWQVKLVCSLSCFGGCLCHDFFHFIEVYLFKSRLAHSEPPVGMRSEVVQNAAMCSVMQFLRGLMQGLHQRDPFES